MIAKEGFPGLQRPTLPRHHVFRHRRLGNLDAELEQLTMDLGRSPERVLKAHSSDQVANLVIDPRSATERAGLPSPVSGEPHSVPAHDRLGPDDGYGVQDARKAAIKPNEQSPIGPTQIRSTRGAQSKYVKLMAQNHNFSLKLRSRLEAVAQHANEKEGNCDHQPQLCCDSSTAATPPDGVFGSDRPTSAIYGNEHSRPDQRDHHPIDNLYVYKPT